MPSIIWRPGDRVRVLRNRMLFCFGIIEQVGLEGCRVALATSDAPDPRDKVLSPEQPRCIVDEIEYENLVHERPGPGYFSIRLVADLFNWIDEQNKRIQT